MTGYEMLGKWRELSLPKSEGFDVKLAVAARKLQATFCAEELQPFLEALSAAVKEFTAAANGPDFHFEYRDAMQRCADTVQRIVGRKL